MQARLGTLSSEDADRIFFWQPLIALLFVFGSSAYVFGKIQRAQEARDGRILKEVELRKLRASRMAGGKEDADLDLAAMEAEIESLRAVEQEEQKLVKVGEDTETTEEFSISLRLPTTEVSRKYAKLEAEAASSRPARPVSEELEVVGLVVGTILLVAFLLRVSG